ncbi:hypothetical protein J2S43_001716 [Catenuloplanes nepalensis]|uniref:Uncharacterized protein n=1 Tax=Catenuloplanes nepalensis TaxID=587533 RepID=A0ABT9MP89_9ACTN|nr:hypothetical protein [Catenuloplanes nepalensis]MDP9793204.1 hypothetical protein [Catenuloplanes nepalensis]
MCTVVAQNRDDAPPAPTGFDVDGMTDLIQRDVDVSYEVPIVHA